MPERYPHQQLAEQMVKDQLESRGVSDPAVLRAMRLVPRHAFVPHLPPEEAYEDAAKKTANGQTISQPYVVAAMTEAARVVPGMDVLEVGGGSGYQAAILAHLGCNVWSVERDTELANAARERLAGMGLSDQVKLVTGDGSLGWPAAAPYDRILVTCAAPDVPDALKGQTKQRGRIIIPVGPRDSQTLIATERHDTMWTREDLFECRFVPLIGAQGWAPEDSNQ